MCKQLTEQDARQTLHAHAECKGAEIYEKFGQEITWHQLKEILNDRASTRYPCEITFDSSQLFSGELAHASPRGKHPEEGFLIHVHPVLMTRLDLVPYVVLYQLVVVNYGEFASSEDAEIFAARALGMGKQEYYEALCSIVDEFAQCSSERAK